MRPAEGQRASDVIKSTSKLYIGCTKDENIGQAIFLKII